MTVKSVMIEGAEQFIIEIRTIEDQYSDSGLAWIVDILDTNGECLVEWAGVASRLSEAIEEASSALVSLLDNDYQIVKA